MADFRVGLIPRPEASYRVRGVWVMAKPRKAGHDTKSGRSATEKKKYARLCSELGKMWKGVVVAYCERKSCNIYPKGLRKPGKPWWEDFVSL